MNVVFVAMKYLQQFAFNDSTCILPHFSDIDNLISYDMYKSIADVNYTVTIHHHCSTVLDMCIFCGEVTIAWHVVIHIWCQIRFANTSLNSSTVTVYVQQYFLNIFHTGVNSYNKYIPHHTLKVIVFNKTWHFLMCNEIHDLLQLSVS